MTEIHGAVFRQDFQEQIEGVRAKSIAIVSDAVRAARDATAAVANGDMKAETLTEMEAAAPTAMVGEVEHEVLVLLALQGPVARDLRVILTARDVAQLGELCLGLCFTLARLAGEIQEILSDDLRSAISELGEKTSLLLSRANDAWSAIDPDESEAVIASADEVRGILRNFSVMCHQVSVSGVAVQQVVDLGTVARMYMRLTDHAVDIATRVQFAANGTPPSHSLRSLED
jgi:phosphate transport system protein